MHSIDFPTLLTIMYVLVDDWYKENAPRLLQGKVGAKPVFSDSELITLMLAMDFLSFESETQFLAFMRANYLALFPKLCDQSQFNRRSRSLRLLVEQLRRRWLEELRSPDDLFFLLDTKPVPVLSYKRSKKRSDFRQSAGYGYCSARHFHYFGYKFVAVTTFSGLPVAFEMVAANTDERAAAEEVLCRLRSCDIFGDKGFIGAEWQQEVKEQTGNRVWTAKRVNQKEQNPVWFDRLLSSVRERIEGSFNELQNTGRNMERLLAKTVIGLTTRVIAKVTSYTLKQLLRNSFGLDVQTFQVAVA
jgi:Transposase DDE domain